MAPSTVVAWPQVTAEVMQTLAEVAPSSIAQMTATSSLAASLDGCMRAGMGDEGEGSGGVQALRPAVAPLGSCMR